MVEKKRPQSSFSEQAAINLADRQLIVPNEPQTPPKDKRAKSQKASTTKDLHLGHRDRLRARFLETNGKGLADYEYLELILFRVIARADTKPLAKALIKHFGSLSDVFGADIHRLQDVKGCGPAVALEIKIIAQCNQRILRAQLNKRNVFTSWDKVIAYCKAATAHETREQFRILFLDKKNGLITDEVQQTGTIDHTPVYPREVIKRALELSASSIILVHNHPSGDPTPSREDVAMTQKLKESAAILNITIHDHIIIGRYGHASFKALSLL